MAAAEARVEERHSEHWAANLVEFKHMSPRGAERHPSCVAAMTERGALAQHCLSIEAELWRAGGVTKWQQAVATGTSNAENDAH